MVRRKGLAEYERKRDFRRTPEPPGAVRKSKAQLAFVIQKHAASRLHYDFRLEHSGVLKSWAVPKGPSLDPTDKRLAVQVEDHPLAYGSFEGVIPKGEYGAGSVLVWDRGRWFPDDDVDEGLRKGKLEFRLEGEKLSGGWRLIQLRGPGNEDGRNWLLMKRGDEAARPAREYKVTDELPASVKSGRPIEAIGEARKRSAAGGAPAKTSRPASKKKKSTQRKASAKSKPRARPAALAAALASLSAAKRGALPATIAPQLATLVSAVPTGADWLHEIKFDGYRMLARLEKGRVRWLSRNGRDWSDRFAPLALPVQSLPAKSALLDGEVVALRPDGTTSFHELQKALSEGRPDTLTYYAFDLLHLDGSDLRPCALEERKEVLRLLLHGVASDAPLRYSDHISSEGSSFYREACRAALEGIICKRRDLPYTSGRTRDWVKVKCGHEQEFVVVGFTKPSGSRVGLGALVLGVYEDEGLRYAGRVGTGLDRAMLLALRKKLQPLIVPDPPFESLPPAAARRGVSWVRPEVVVEVGFTEWTADGSLRHPTLKGVREDKPAREIVREEPDSPPSPRKKARRGAAARTPRAASKTGAATRGRSSRASSDTEATDVAGIAISHPDRDLYPDEGITKLELARFYESIAPRILPHLADRPLSVVRCPQGSGKQCFFQKHTHGHFPDAVKSVAVKESKASAHYLMVDSVEGLVALVQMGVLELHPWGSRADRIENPDRLFFDLDPAPDVPWERVVEAALLLRELLERLELLSFLKTTGGKGLHVVVPLTRKHDWDAVKGFSHEIAIQMSQAAPELYVATASKAVRKGKIFIDYLRNGRGSTAVAPYSTRAKPGAPVSTPVAWKELDSDLRSDTFTVRNLAARLDRRGYRDPWADFLQTRQTLRSRRR